MFPARLNAELSQPWQTCSTSKLLVAFCRRQLCFYRSDKGTGWDQMWWKGKSPEYRSLTDYQHFSQLSSTLPQKSQRVQTGACAQKEWRRQDSGYGVGRDFCFLVLHFHLHLYLISRSLQLQCILLLFTLFSPVLFKSWVCRLWREVFTLNQATYITKEAIIVRKGEHLFSLRVWLLNRYLGFNEINFR